MRIPIIDLFAGPGGLGEGFSSLVNKGKRIFDIRLSIEKDANAHKTLELRSFFRQFPIGKAPEEYYDVLRARNIDEREKLKRILYQKYSDEYDKAKTEAWQAEVGTEAFPPEFIDSKIRAAIGDADPWVLIGGPPCQAYSLVGRSRVGGIDENDHRVYLYKEYLRIIAVHHPAVFVMENVKGLLSAKVNDERVFSWILRDLRNPAQVFPELESPGYKIYSLSTPPLHHDHNEQPIYQGDQDFLIKSEMYGIPQKRHRVILLGIREDIKVIPGTLIPVEKTMLLKQVIDDLPVIRSGISKSYVSSKTINGKKKRLYRSEPDTDNNWQNTISSMAGQINSWNGLTDVIMDIKKPSNGTGSEFIPDYIPSQNNPLIDWFHDPEIKGVCNHQSRSHLVQDLKRYLFSALFARKYNRFPRLKDFSQYSSDLMPDHKSALSGKFADRFRVQLPDSPATTVTSHISKDGHYFIHYDPSQCRSLTVREAARIQTFPDNYLFCGSRTAQFHQVGNAVPPLLANQIAGIVYMVFKAIRKKASIKSRFPNF
jgi:DNA (cytosine-5)-methyltransferase 1